MRPICRRPDEVVRSIGRMAAVRRRTVAVGGGNGGGGVRRCRRAWMRRAARRVALAPAQLMTAQVPDIRDGARAVSLAKRRQPFRADAVVIDTFPALIALAADKRDIIIKMRAGA